MKNLKIHLSKVIRGFRILWRVLIPLLSACVGLWLIDHCNIFDYIGLLKEVDKSFDIGVTVYFATVDIILTSITNVIDTHFFGKQSIEVVFSTSNMQGTKESIPVLDLLDGKVAEARVTVKISAKRDTVKALKIKIPAVNFATMQPPTASKAVNLDGNANLIISVEDIISNQEYVVTEQTFRILFLREPISGRSMHELVPAFNDYPLTLDIAYNKLRLCAEV